MKKIIIAVLLASLAGLSALTYNILTSDERIAPQASTAVKPLTSADEVIVADTIIDTDTLRVVK